MINIEKSLAGIKVLVSQSKIYRKYSSGNINRIEHEITDVEPVFLGVNSFCSFSDVYN